MLDLLQFQEDEEEYEISHMKKDELFEALPDQISRSETDACWEKLT